MVSISGVGSADVSGALAGRRIKGLRVVYRLLRRRWRRWVWEARLRHELTDDRLLADIGRKPDIDRQRIAGMARALGGSPRRSE